jgi:hypothetical protein
LEEIFEQIDLIEAQKLQDLSIEMLDPKQLSCLIFEP